MTQEEKEEYLDRSKSILQSKSSAISRELEFIPQESLKLKELLHGSASDVLTYHTMIAMYRKRYEALANLHSSPYFYSCKVKLDGENHCRELYFAKFSFDQESIYSWASPISQIRFESPGKFSFESHGGKQTGEIFEKDQYLIADNKILFLATENQERRRELVYQEYFSTRKTAFVLPEIVAQMEKAQDQVVRADFGGKLVVTGPAGSGKTTLALHRVAYLLQSPETADRLDVGEVIVFVQDDSTRDYFSHLLPELGIKDVEITTLAAWAKKVLPLEGWTIKDHEGDGDAAYVWAKIKSARMPEGHKWRKDWHNILTDSYASCLNENQLKQFAAQKKNKILDRVDLAILLKSIAKQDDGFNVEKEYYTANKKNQEVKRKKSKIKTAYKLMIIDEFQNYMPEHLELFGQAVSKEDGETVYIGDFNQRVRLGTINDLADIGDMSKDRLVKLSKVYRNTKEILQYLNRLGYSVDIPEMIKSGPEAVELAMADDEGIAYVRNELRSLNDVSIGILSHNDDLLKRYYKEFGELSNVKIMPLIDAQGVEFDTVFIVGIDDSLLSLENAPEQMREEMSKIKRDLLYIALTRAMNSLHVIGRNKLSELLGKQ